MANIEFIRQMRLKYDKNYVADKRPLLEHLQINDPDKIEKALQTRAVSLLKGDYKRYFVDGEAVPVFLLFIDVCGFSTRFKHLTGKQVSEYFDDYYSKVIPIIYKFGGEIDKIIGDGLIVVFGEPFLKCGVDKSFRLAAKCARNIIAKTKGTKYSSKVALNYGKVNYFKNKSLHYSEFTLVGKPLTELFRLESVSENDAVNFYADGQVYDFYSSFLKNDNKGNDLRKNDIVKDPVNRRWIYRKKDIPVLPGVSELLSSIFYVQQLN